MQWMQCHCCNLSREMAESQGMGVVTTSVRARARCRGALPELTKAVLPKLARSNSFPYRFCVSPYQSSVAQHLSKIGDRRWTMAARQSKCKQQIGFINSVVCEATEIGNWRRCSTVYMTYSEHRASSKRRRGG